MATKAGMGRLTFSGRQEYEVMTFYLDSPQPVAYAAVCLCALGNHYLAMWPDGSLDEYTITNNATPYLFSTYADAQAAIEQWQRQHDAAQAASGETQEG